MFQNATRAHSSANASRKFSSPTQRGVPMMLHSVNATYAPEEDGHDVEDEERDGEEGDEEVADPVHLPARRRAANRYRLHVHRRLAATGPEAARAAVAARPASVLEDRECDARDHPDPPGAEGAIRRQGAGG